MYKCAKIQSTLQTQATLHYNGLKSHRHTGVIPSPFTPHSPLVLTSFNIFGYGWRRQCCGRGWKISGSTVEAGIDVGVIAGLVALHERTVSGRRIRKRAEWVLTKTPSLYNICTSGDGYSRHGRPRAGRDCKSCRCASVVGCMILMALLPSWKEGRS